MRLRGGGRLFDALLRQAVLKRPGHAAELLHLGDVLARARHEIGGQPLDEPRAAPRIDDARGAGFQRQDELRVARDAGGEIGGKRQRLVERVGVQRLGSAGGGGHRLDHGARDVVEHVLRGQRPAGGLAMRAQHGGARIAGAEAFRHKLAPQAARGAQLRHFEEVAHAGIEEEGEPRREGIDLQACGDAGAHIFQTVGERVGELQVDRRAGFLDVIAGNGDRVEARHVLRGVGEDVGDDPHRMARRVDVGVADQKLLQHVVLDGAGQRLRLHALALRRDDVERHDRQHGAVHGHGDGHLVERNAVEQLFHVEDGIDGDARHADIAGHARVVGIVAAMRRQVEGDGEALLTRRQIAPVERVGIARRGEARVLADGPRALDIHGGVGAAQIGRQPRHAVDAGKPRDVVGAVGGANGDALGRMPVRSARRVGHCGRRLPGRTREVGERHQATASASCSRRTGVRPGREGISRAASGVAFGSSGTG